MEFGSAKKRFIEKLHFLRPAVHFCFFQRRPVGHASDQDKRYEYLLR